MAVKSESEINGVEARALRQRLDLPLRIFWPAICVSYSAGACYESGRNRIPDTVKRLVFLQYVVGIPTQMTPQDVAPIAALLKNKAKLARIVRNNQRAAALLLRSTEEINGLSK